MGQATIDLPDPLEPAQAPTAPINGADDLLAQLAGDEIDRLLAESEHEAPPSRSDEDEGERQRVKAAVERAEESVAAAKSVTNVSAEPASFSPVADLPAVIAPNTDTTPIVPTNANASHENETRIADQISARPAIEAAAAVPIEAVPEAEAPIADQIAAALSPPATESPAPTHPPQAEAIGSIQQSPDQEVDSSTFLSAEIELAAMSSPDAASSLADFAGEVNAAAQSGSDRVPLLLRPLEWLNAPFDALPDSIREAMGKIALLTLFNAAAVLIFVLLFRRHH